MNVGRFLRKPLVAIVLLYLLVGVASLNEMLMYTPDSARYLMWAESLANFDGFKDTTHPEPTRYVVHAPLYPLLITPAAFLLPGSVAAAKATTVLFGLVVLLLFHRWLRNTIGEREAVVGTAVLAINPLMLVYSTQVLSDVPFAVCVIVFFMLAERLTAQPEMHGLPEAGLIATIVAGIFLREVGLTLMLGAVGYFFYLKQHRRALLILFVSLLFYALWFIRNEVVIAAIENPPMRNTRLFFTHYFTSNDVSLLTELGTRFWSNLQVYLSLLGRLVLYPDFAARQMGVISPDDPLVAGILSIMPWAQYILATVTLLLVALGIWRAARTWRGFPVTLIFIVFYFGPILFYPINDIRFLFPIVLLMLLFGMFGVAWMYERLNRPTIHRIAIVFGVILLLPNLVWIQSYVRNSLSFGADPVALYRKISTAPAYPEQFAKPLHLAAEWLKSNTPPSAVITSRWKEIGYWTGGRKVIDTDPNVTPDHFNQMVRNYNVRYVVTIASRVGLWEHEALFVQSGKYTFRHVHSVANVGIFEVHPQGKRHDDPPAVSTRADSVRLQFSAALRLLDGGTPEVAETLLTRLVARVGRYGAIIFHIGVAKEFAGHLDDAARQFEGFRAVQQAGSYIQQAWYHQEIIARLHAAEQTTLAEDRANRFHVVAVNYWELGFRRQSLRLLDRAIQSDSSFFPAHIFSAIFRLKLGEHARARIDYERAKALAAENVLVSGVNAVLQTTDSLRRNPDPVTTVALLRRRGEAFGEMGMWDDVIDDMLAILALYPDDPAALRKLGDLFSLKSHLEPAFRMYARLEALNRTDEVVHSRLEELRRRWE